ncbi:hypothetical protein EFW17_17655 [Halostreptopolyspora alba]|uniref:Uncharacterized protein n=1 Tax=Halostreptopolyspora alba TaxID=2487137 RepID=A0A3N0E5C3_9ACTN|nr:hypothetical protein EFW17_17655 [Nocardiopsaceae bacterium YIM 96095]
MALTATEASRTASPGRNRLVTVRGYAAPPAEGPPIAPVSERPCAWWALRMRPLRRWLSLGTVPTLPSHAQAAAAFAVVDDGNRVRVEPDQLVCYGRPPSATLREPQPGRFGSGPVLPPVTRRVGRRLPDLGETIQGSYPLRAVEFAEWRLEEGEQVAVTGELGVDPNTGEAVLRGHRPSGLGRATVFGMTPGRDRTDVSDLLRHARRGWLVGGGIALVVLCVLAVGLYPHLGELGSAILGSAGVAS